MPTKKSQYFEGTGRRKTSIARVRIYKTKEFKPTVNDRNPTSYFAESDLPYINQPLNVTNLRKDFSWTVHVKGGGISAWKDAIRLGLARALLKYDPELKPTLKKAGLLTRDPRMVERKKPGLKKARKAPRFSKR